MIKISYPTNSTELQNFKDDYFTALTHFDEVEINNHLLNIPFKGIPLTFKRLIQLDFSELIDLEPDIKRYSETFKTLKKGGRKKTYSNKFDELFVYKSNQPGISTFFMCQKSINIKTCHYCSIDYIYAFIDIGDYLDGLDFINRADAHDLMIVKDIGTVTAQRIITERKRLNGFTDIKQTGCFNTICRRIEQMKFVNTHNTFTLDHVFPQKSHRFYSLCIFNLVPSCYSCNAKFKKVKNFTIDRDLKFISPTSPDYSFPDDFRFKVFFTRKLRDIKSESDFVLQNEKIKNEQHINNYLEIFKIQGRYSFLKDKILPIIRNKVKYSDSQINELSKKTGISQISLRKMIFGEELFNQKSTNHPLIKFKRDIALNIKVKGVV